jgi:T4 RnlA family RNA ligase
MKLEVQKFIESHSDWEKLLAEKPYCITVSRDEFKGRRLVMFKYSQVDSDFNESIVRECRGLVLDEDTLEIVSFPFMKFFNVQESSAAKIDWKTARISEKVDGSLIKVVNVNGDLLISTNGTIDAFKAPLVEQVGCKWKSFGELVREVFFKKNIENSMFEEGFTYMFELTSPYTRIVIPYSDIDLHFLGKRDNKTFQETYFTDDQVMSGLFNTPEVYSLKTVDECIDAAKELPWDEEGYVVCDKDFHRVKVKSPSYCAVHHLKGEGGVMSYRRAVEIVRANEIDEICSYFEEFRSALEECKSKFWKLVEDCEACWNDYLKVDSSLSTRKDKAIWITQHAKIPGLFFGLLDKKVPSVRDFFMTMPAEKLLKYLGYKE